ncbi:thioredoxin-like protein [Martensiomyces pterosporus]|nr:thioredoxin-like protein [Martensiomyces pterosporus]
MGSPEIVFYFDCASSFSYIGFEFMERYKKLWGIKVDYCPFVLGDVMAKAKNTFSPYKLPYLFTDLKRTSSITGIPFKGVPKKYPYDPTNALRTLQYLKTRHPDLMTEAMRRLWNMEYVQLKAPESVDDIKQALTGHVNPSIVDQAVGADDTLGAIVQNTEAVKKLHGFGAPTILVSKGDGSKPQFFFGSDRFEHIAIYLGKEFHPMKQLFANARL